MFKIMQMTLCFHKFHVLVESYILQYGLNSTQYMIVSVKVREEKKMFITMEKT